MAEIFVNQIITEAGYNIIAEATSSNPIEYIGALSNASVPSDPTDRSSYTGRAGQVDAASATENVARIIASYLNNDLDSPQPVKAIALLGKLSSQPDAQAVVVAYAADPDSEIVLPRSSAPEQVTRFAFNLTFNPGTTVSVFQTGDATIEDLSRLVSCHKAGQPTVGADQTILGRKTFEDTVYVSTMRATSATDRVLIASRGASNPCAVSVGWQSTLSRNAVMIGGASYGWVFDNQYLKPLVASTSQIGTPSEKVNKAYIASIGDSSNRADTVYATVADATALRTNAITSANDSIALEKTILPSTPETYNFGSQNYKFNEIHANKFYGTLVGGSTGGVFTNMTASGVFSGAFNGDLNGLIPQPSEAADDATYQPAPIGSIILALINGWDWSDNTYLRCGKLVSQGVTCTLYPARYDAESGFIVNTSVLLPLEQGVYRMLSEVNTHVGSSERRMIALVMRVS